MEHQLNFKSKLKRFRQTPRLSQASARGAILIYDRRLEKKYGKFIRGFPARIPVTAGEDLKTLVRAEKILEHLLKLSAGHSRSEICIYALGGGSVGDFAGFCASILKRGVSLIQIPSTWLAAIDSAHGGKTALNVGGMKNQIGSFWPAREVWLIEEILRAQPAERLHEAWGEIYKMGLIRGGILWSQIRRAAKSRDEAGAVWALLPRLVAAKNEIVLKDPFERTHHRALLNLGHTLGHVLEARSGFPHGRAVLFGLAFAVEWSKHLELIGGRWSLVKDFEKIHDLPHWPSRNELSRELRRRRNWEKDLRHDKKSENGDSLRFIFVLRPGHCEARRLPVKEMVAEIRRQAVDGV